VLKIIIGIFMAFLFVGCGAKDPYLQTVDKVDIQKYKGTWYEIARFEHFFEKGCKNVTATYELKDNGKIKVINRCTNIEDGEKKEAIGEAYALDATNSKLKVSFFKPFYGDYWIIDLDKKYNYALVGSPNREYLWILSRTKTISEEVKNSILKNLPEHKFDKSKFIWTIQE
jgi:apolipoprotein D and lipocalin family protein